MTQVKTNILQQEVNSLNERLKGALNNVENMYSKVSKDGDAVFMENNKLLRLIYCEDKNNEENNKLLDENEQEIRINNIATKYVVKQLSYLSYLVSYHIYSLIYKYCSNEKEAREFISAVSHKNWVNNNNLFFTQLIDKVDENSGDQVYELKTTIMLKKYAGAVGEGSLVMEKLISDLLLEINFDIEDFEGLKEKVVKAKKSFSTFLNQNYEDIKKIAKEVLELKDKEVLERRNFEKHIDEMRKKTNVYDYVYLYD